MLLEFTSIYYYVLGVRGVAGIDLETLLKIAGEKPYQGPDYSAKRRKLTKKLKEIFAKHFNGKADQIIESLTSRRGFTPSDQLLKYSSKAFERVVDEIIAVCKIFMEFDENKEKELKRDILKVVIEVKNDP
jgi:hypothetical protein